MLVQHPTSPFDLIREMFGCDMTKNDRKATGNKREDAHKNPDIEIHLHRKDGNDITLVAICMTLYHENK